MVDEKLKERFHEDTGSYSSDKGQKEPMIAVLLGLFFPPIGYAYLEAWKFLALNLITLNYLMLGNFLVPIHCYLIIHDARTEEEQQDYEPADTSFDEERF